MQQSQPASGGSSLSSTSFRTKLDNRSGVQPFTTVLVITGQRQVTIGDKMFPQSTETRNIFEGTYSEPTTPLI